MHTHGNVLSSVEPIARAAQGYMRYERMVHPLRFLHTLPLSHVFGQTMGLWVPPIFAAEVHFESRLVAPRLIETIRKERISVLAAVPRVMALLKTYLEKSQPGLAERVASSQNIGALKRWWRFRDVHRAFGPKFWALISGGGALAGTLELFWNRLGFVMVQGYGMTETMALITLNHPFHVAQGTIGKPLPGREVKLGPDGEVLVRGPMISGATWSGGELRKAAADKGGWLATGDLAETQESGELRFKGRKSEAIVTAAGVNVHPEDLEAALDEQPEIAACAVIAMETAAGPEPCAVLAMRGGEKQAAAAVERANEQLADFQKMRRWALWPEPDLPRTSTGKVRRQAVATWLAENQPATNGRTAKVKTGGDWLVALIAEIAGEAPLNVDDEMRLSEDLHLDSLGRVQLAAALEERLGTMQEEGAVDQARTLGDLRRLAGIGETRARSAVPEEVEVLQEEAELVHAGGGDLPRRRGGAGYRGTSGNGDGGSYSRLNSHDNDLPMEPALGASMWSCNAVADGTPSERATQEITEKADYVYPHWPWMLPVQWMRAAFIELVVRPLVWLLAGPRVDAVHAGNGKAEPMLIVCNHVTAYDGPLVQFALPGGMRRHMATAMSGEMLEDFRHFRNPKRRPGQRGFMLLGPVAYVLVTALFNVFPLPRRRNFQRSFAHAGEALDRGFNVLVFPEGARSAEGELARFRPGIGMLVKQSQTAVLPLAILGLGALKERGRGWFRSGTIEVRVGVPLRFGPEESESAITARLQTAVEELMSRVPAN